MRRRGFTLVEMLAVLAIIMILAAIVVPRIAQEAGRATGPAVLSSTSTIADAISQFKADTRRYPERLRTLVNPAGAGQAGDPEDICQATIPQGLLSRWSGPYLQQQVPATGLVAGDAVIQDSLFRADPNAGTDPVSSLVITVVGVDSVTAVRIDAEMDGNGDLNGGTIRWTAPSTLYYYVPIRGC